MALKKIAVIGATGMLGIPVVAELVKAGFEVTALVRNLERAKRVLPAQTNLVQADAADADSLKRGLAGQDAIYLSLSIAPSERKGVDRTRNCRDVRTFHKPDAAAETLIEDTSLIAVQTSGNRLSLDVSRPTEIAFVKTVTVDYEPTK